HLSSHCELLCYVTGTLALRALHSFPTRRSSDLGRADLLAWCAWSRAASIARLDAAYSSPVPAESRAAMLVRNVERSCNGMSRASGMRTCVRNVGLPVE